MRKTFLIATACLSALALAACNQQKGSEPAGQTDPVDTAQDLTGAATGVATGAAGAVNTETFLRDAAISDMYEIEAAKMALQRSQNAQIRKAAEQIITDHTASSAELKTLAASKGWTLPTEMDERRKGMLDNLRSASAADFDDRYLDQQTMAHHEALLLFNGYRGAGPDAELKAFAGKVAPKLEAHANMVTALDRGSTADDQGTGEAEKK